MNKVSSRHAEVRVPRGGQRNEHRYIRNTRRFLDTTPHYSSSDSKPAVNAKNAIK